MPEPAFTEALEQGVFKEFDVRVRANRLHKVRIDQESSERREVQGDKVIALSLLQSEGNQTSPLFSGIESLTSSHSQGKDAESVVGSLIEGLNGKVIFTTLRSGQRIESERSVVVVGDVNSGAEVIAGGSVIVLGSLRGVAHAGAYEDSEGPAYIFALNLRPTQLRIGSVITRGASEGVGSGSGEPEIARVDGSTILVEKYHPRVVMHRGPRSAPV
jgi:septum site-determining protein MinC